MFRQQFSYVDEQAACLFLTVCVIHVASKHGIRLVPQAGSCFWRRVPIEMDDGAMVTHFGYQWELSPRTIFEIKNNRLPEIHVWAGDPITQEVVDLTAGSFPAQCKTLTGEDWFMPLPPSYIWMPGKKALTRYDASYEADMQATNVAIEMFKRHLQERRSR